MFNRTVIALYALVIIAITVVSVATWLGICIAAWKYIAS